LAHLQRKIGFIAESVSGDGLYIRTSLSHLFRQAARSHVWIKQTIVRRLRRPCHAAGGELKQIQFLLGHKSAETTERYLGSWQRIVAAVTDKIGLEPDFGEP